MKDGLFEHVRSLGRDGAELRADEEPRAAGLVECVPDFAGAVPEVDRHHDGAQLGQRKVADDVLHTVAAQHRDPVTLRHAQRSQPVRQPIDLAIERGIGPRLITPDERGLTSAQLGMGLFAEDVTEQQHGIAQRSAIGLDLASLCTAHEELTRALDNDRATDLAARPAKLHQPAPLAQARLRLQRLDRPLGRHGVARMDGADKAELLLDQGQRPRRPGSCPAHRSSCLR